MKIGIDLDNVVVATTDAVIEYLNERVPELNIKIEDIKTYWMEKNLPPGYELLVKEAFESRHMWKKVKLVKDAKKYIKKLYKDGHEIYFVTSSLPSNLDKKIKHLARNLNFLPKEYVWKHTINIHKKQLLNLDVLIDDCYDNLVGDKNYYSICFSYPWNENVDISFYKYSKPDWRVWDWAAAYNIISKLEEDIKWEGSKN